MGISNISVVAACLYLGLPVIHMAATLVLLKIVSREGNV